MELVLQRQLVSPEDTIGHLFSPETFLAFTLEDEPREKKVHSETRIPAGRYKLDLRPAGRLHKIYSDRWDWHTLGMIWVRRVPNFRWIYFHPGVNDDHTAGCILVGDQVNNNILAPGADNLGSSRQAYKRIYPVITEAILLGPTFVTIRDEVPL